MIAIIDYDMGNMRSIEKALDRFCAEYIVTSDSKIVKKADKIILPGVGFFKTGMENLVKLGLLSTLKEVLYENKKPFLGICVGMQLLFESSEEGFVSGIGAIKGEIKKFELEGLKVPHIGWNEVKGVQNIKIMKGIEDCSNFYFVHSYFATIREDINYCTTDYGISFISVIEKGNIWGTQFHPEKSQNKGLQILKNFMEL